ncbi:uncharacterized protein SCODWIG_02926 [Saccharomycodes ludwigii]|uniref:TEL2-interacting protein 1 n=1 Tax=Saccharomycodes ludwigii TaxID=36035 RepID=A0A376B926_9ASCO|nr:hypothetical protein SCDLUD_005241 [Saccharomycodes ludwigii]KAH3898899.1 hypothetical protein SCDLUD_005241 [Saccharomycodes ludwigii]SSD61165.1 uncharacterized protein SCODWIG_02926 [Saccharomycodes ludwigii]
MSSISHIFQEIRPVCVELSRYVFLPDDLFDENDPHMLQKLDQIYKILNINLNSKDNKKQDLNSPQFAEYCFVPLSQLLKHNIKSQYCKQYILKCLVPILQIWNPMDFQVFKQLLPILLVLLLDNNSKVSDSELFIDIFLNFTSPTKAIVINNEHDTGLLGLLAQVIVKLLKILELKKNLSLKYRLKIVTILTNIYVEIFQKNGEILSFILPGNISSLVKVIIGVSSEEGGHAQNKSVEKLTTNFANSFNPSIGGTNTKVPYPLVIDCLQLLQKIICIVYNDEDNTNNVSSVTTIADIIDDKETNGPYLQVSENDNKNSHPHRDEKWLRGTKTQVYKGVSTVLSQLLNRNNVYINQEIINFCSEIIRTCNSSLDNCRELLTKALLQLSSDNLQLIKTDDVENIINTVDIQKTIRFEQISTFQVLINSISYVKNYECLHILVVQIYENLKNVIKPKKPAGNMLLREEYTMQSPIIIPSQIEAIDTVSLLNKVLSKEIEGLITRLLNVIGQNIPLQEISNIIEYLLSDDDTGVGVWVAAELLHKIGTCGTEQEMQYLVVSDDEGMDEELHANIELVLENCNENITHILFHNNEFDEFKLTVSLYSINALGCEILQSNFKTNLIDFLPPIIECLAMDNEKVRRLSQIVVCNTAKMVANMTVVQLVHDNIDYIVDYCGLKLNNFLTARVGVILSVVCQLGGYEIISNFKDILENLFRFLDYYHGYESLCIEFYRFFIVIIKEVKKKYGNDLVIEHKRSCNTTFKPWGMENIEQIITFLDDNKGIPLEETINNGEVEELIGDSDDELEDENTEIPWVSPIPKDTYTLLVQISNYGERLLTHNSNVLKNLILSAYIEIIPLLASQYNSFLPQVAQSMWHIVVECSLQNDIFIEPCCKALQLMIRYSGDFISKRFINLYHIYDKSESINKYFNGVKDRKAQDGAIIQVPRTILRKKLAISYMFLEGVKVVELTMDDVDIETVVRKYCMGTLSVDEILDIYPNSVDFIA